MVKVCQEEFPETDGFYMDGLLKNNLDILVDSIKDDFDFIILISGRGMVRVGKSQIGKQVSYYINSEVRKKYKVDNTFTTDNFAFRGKDLIEKGKVFPKFSVLDFDEAGADLVGRKIMQQTTQAVLDYIRECGQQNHFLILILPEFFDLPKGIALTRSVCLIDVDFRERFNRGLFRFYGRKAKKLLYLYGKKNLDYGAYKPDFFGTFTDFEPIDGKKYKEMKYAALTGRKLEEVNRINLRELKANSHRNEVAYWAIDIKKGCQRDLARFCNVEESAVDSWREQYRRNNGIKA